MTGKGVAGMPGAFHDPDAAAYAHLPTDQLCILAPNLHNTAATAKGSASIQRLHKTDDIADHSGVPEIVMPRSVVDQHLLWFGSNVI
ncbi:hypothetical protein ABIE78_002564 [Sinorhizobium fredii]